MPFVIFGTPSIQNQTYVHSPPYLEGDAWGNVVNDTVGGALTKIDWLNFLDDALDFLGYFRHSLNRSGQQEEAFQAASKF
jgi:hypothetical protein